MSYQPISACAPAIQSITSCLLRAVCQLTGLSHDPETVLSDSCLQPRFRLQESVRTCDSLHCALVLRVMWRTYARGLVEKDVMRVQSSPTRIESDVSGCCTTEANARLSLFKTPLRRRRVPPEVLFFSASDSTFVRLHPSLGSVAIATTVLPPNVAGTRSHMIMHRQTL